jgi:hypothetical protein
LSHLFNSIAIALFCLLCDLPTWDILRFNMLWSSIKISLIILCLIHIYSNCNCATWVEYEFILNLDFCWCGVVINRTIVCVIHHVDQWTIWAMSSNINHTRPILCVTYTIMNKCCHTLFSSVLLHCSIPMWI